MDEKENKHPVPNLEEIVQRRAFWACVVLVCAFSVLSARLVVLGVVKHDKLAGEAAMYHIRKQTLPSKRGAILDRNGDTLAADQQVYRLVVYKNHLQNHKTAIKGVATATGMDPDEVRRNFSRQEVLAGYERWIARVLHREAGIGESESALTQKIASKSRGEIRLKRGIEEDERRQLLKVMEEQGVHGVYFQAESRRFYPIPNRLTHVLGYTDHEHVGREGVERTMNEVMSGTDGYRYIERNSRGQEIAAFRGEEVQPVNGSNVRLTIDMGMQNIVERGLNRGVERFQPEKISTVWMDPYTGEILSMASRPDFDLNTREGNRRNIAIADQYEPGSTFKIVAVGGALDQQLLHLQTQIFCHWGQMTEHNGLIVKDHHPYGDLTTELVVAKSSNIGAYKVAKLLGPVRLHQYMGYFGFGERTGIKLTGEVAGRVYHPDEWSGTSFSSMAMGYEVAVTPLQMATALSAIANGGLLMQPRVISNIENDEEEVLEKTDTRVVRRVLSSAAADSMRHAMQAVTAQGGTATRANFPGYMVAGKTGTARKYSTEAKGYVDGRYVCSFMGFFPADNPRVVGIVVVDDPVKPADDPEMPLYGGTVAAPIFAEMAAKIAAYLEIPASTPPTDLVQNQPLANATSLPR